jgi:hypothetical protein
VLPAASEVEVQREKASLPLPHSVQLGSLQTHLLLDLHVNHSSPKPMSMSK